jgi:hypothetical protein
MTMKPTNSKSEGCGGITSSNCVIWQGPDIECINLCKGDTVSDVVAKLATELCKLIDMFNIDAYELTCLNLGDCGPTDFQGLINLLIERICEQEGITPTTPSAEGCPDCTVNIAECFYYQNPQGDTVTTMQLTDYVNAIGNTVCTLVAQITTINEILVSLGDRITTLENAPAPTLDLPLVTPVCVTGTPGTAQEMNVVLSALEARFCELIGATGSAVDIFQSIAKQCAGLNTAPVLSGSGTMGSITGWQSTVSNLADAINNIWLTICDMRAAILTIQDTCCPNDCDGVAVELYAVLTDPTTLKLNFTGTIPAGFTDCGGTTSFTISDQSGGSITVNVPVTSNLNNALGFNVDLTSTPVNTAENLTITANAFCVSDGESTCQSVLSYAITNISSCPTVTLTPGTNSIGYSFGWIGGAASITVDLLDMTQTVIVASQTTGVTGPQTVIGNFTGLIPSTLHYSRVTITIGETVTVCPVVPVTTLAEPCIPPTNVVAEINYDGE